jgi:hypothetical protein
MLEFLGVNLVLVEGAFGDRAQVDLVGPIDDTERPNALVNRLGVKWFETRSVSSAARGHRPLAGSLDGVQRSSRKTSSSVRPRGFPWVSRTLPRYHRSDNLERRRGSRSGRPQPPMPAVVVRKTRSVFRDDERPLVSRTTPSEQREGCSE